MEQPPNPAPVAILLKIKQEPFFILMRKRGATSASRKAEDSLSVLLERPVVNELPSIGAGLRGQFIQHW